MYIPWKQRLVGVHEANEDDYKAIVYEVRSGWSWTLTPKAKVLAPLKGTGIAPTDVEARQMAEAQLDKVYGEEGKKLRDAEKERKAKTK